MSSNEIFQKQPFNPEHTNRPCVLCQKRKVRCDRNEPCWNCTRAGVDCISAITLPSRKRKQRLSEADLLARLRRYEHHLRTYGADIDAINSESGCGEGYPVPNSTTIKSNHSDSPRELSSDPAVRSVSVRRPSGHAEHNLSSGVNEAFRDAEELLQGSSDDETFANPLGRTFDGLDGGGEDMLFGPQTAESLKADHPSFLLIFRLWQTFLDNVNPLIKIFHAPSVQQKVLDATTNLDNIPKNTEALMFGIYASATISMSDDECRKLFDETKQEVLARFLSGARQALRSAGYMRSSDIVVLQALTLYLLSSLQRTVNPRSLSCLTGVAVRVAQRMGLSTDKTTYAIPPFEAEMRRRLWWQILLIDLRVAELSGAGSSILTYTWNTKLPSNVNDSDLFPDMRDPPVERPGLTEMIFVRLRCEQAQLLQQLRALTGALVVKEDFIDGYESRLEHEYLSYCDSSIPLHVMSIMMARSAFCKLRMGLRASQFKLDRASHLPQDEKDTLFQVSLRMIEYNNILMKNSSVRHFVWHIYTHSPFPAHVYLLCALRYRTNDEFADRAWQQLSENVESHDLRMKHDDIHFAKQNSNLIHMALGNLVVKAWEAREAASQNLPQALPVPRFVNQYRKQLAEKKNAKSRPLSYKLSPSVLMEQPFGGHRASQSSILDPNAFGVGQDFDQSILPENFPDDLPSNEWELWNGMIQAGDSMQGFDAIPLPYNHFHQSRPF